MDEQILLYIFGTLGIILGSFMSYLFDDRRAIIGFKMLGVACFAIYYSMIGVYTAIFNIAITFSFLLLSYHRQRLPYKNSWGYPLVFLAVNTYLSIQKRQSFASTFSYAGSCANVIARWQIKTKHIRYITIMAVILWTTHNILVQAWFPLVANFVTATSLGIAIYRFDIKKIKNG